MPFLAPLRRPNTAVCGVGLLAVVALVLASLTSPKAQAYPEPELTSQAWELEFQYQKPKLISIRSVDGDHLWYWYMTYTVTNETGQDQMFIPEIEIATDQGDIITAGRDVSARVFRAIKEREDNPLLESSVEVIGKLLQGEDHARDSVAIWPAPNPEVDSLAIFVAGLSGETRVVTDSITGQPIKDEETGKPIVLRKTLMLEYDLPGNPVRVEDQTIEFEGESWIMR